MDNDKENKNNLHKFNFRYHARVERWLCRYHHISNSFHFTLYRLIFFSCAVVPSNTHLNAIPRVYVNFPLGYVVLFTLLKFSGWLNLFFLSCSRSFMEPLLHWINVTKTRHKVYLCAMMIILGWKVFNKSKEIFINSVITYMLPKSPYWEYFLIQASFFLLVVFLRLLLHFQPSHPHVNEVDVNEGKFSWECELRCEKCLEEGGESEVVWRGCWHAHRYRHTLKHAMITLLLNFQNKHREFSNFVVKNFSYDEVLPQRDRCEAL